MGILRLRHKQVDVSSWLPQYLALSKSLLSSMLSTIFLVLMIMKRTQSTKWTALVLPLKPSQNLSSSLNKRNGTIEISRKNSRTCSQISLRCLKRQIKIIRSVKLLELKVLLAIYSHEAVIISKITNMMKVLIIK